MNNNMNNSGNSFCVIKRNGLKEEVSFDKVTRRIKKLCYGLSNDINPIMVAQKVCGQIYNNVSTIELDELAAQICTSLETNHLDYGVLASRIIVSNNHKCTSPSFSETIYILYNNKDKDGNKCPLIADDVYEIVMKNKDKLNAILNYEKDYLFDYFGFKTLEKSYLMKINGKIIERIQHMFLRVSIGIHKEDLRSAIISYELMSSKYFTHATPTLFNSGTRKGSLASCFLLGMEDSVQGIYKNISDCAMISAGAGGIGLTISKIRSKNTYIRGTNGVSNGIVPLCKVLNETARHINQSGKRQGSIAVYIEPHHPEIFEFLELKKNTGAETERARDLFLALWISDLFMKRVESNADWSLFDPDECKGLDIAYGEDFENLYQQYENDGKARKVVSARKLWNTILTSQIETGVPYILFKDSINKKSNHMNVGTITHSNLCVVGETLILTDEGYKEIKSLENKNIRVWNGLEFTDTVVRKTGENQKIIKTVFSDGCELECTEYHKFYIFNEDNKNYMVNNDEIDLINSDIVSKVEAKDLKRGMRLVSCNYPNIGKEDSHFKRWLSQYIDNINDVTSNKEALMKIKLVLNTMGCNSAIQYIDSDKYQLTFDENSLNKLSDLGFDINNDEYKRNPDKFVKVVEIIDENKYADTYCFTESKRNAGIFNGVFAGNCAEITLYSDHKEYAVCTLASIALCNFVIENDENKETNKDTSKKTHRFDFDKLIEVVSVSIRNLNKIIDINYYPVPETERSNKRMRPLGLGVQGLVETYFKMGFPFDSMEARQLNKQIFETIYYSAVKTSHKLALEEGPYSEFHGSPISKGQFQFDLWGIEASMYDWESLRNDVMRDGVRNSTLVALMPTASTSQILGNNECFEPITSNIYTRRTIAGDFIVINKYLVRDLIKLNMWNVDMKNLIIAHNGSIQNIDGIPKEIKDMYKTVWEMKQKVLIDQAIERGPFICQTQSMNLFFEEPTQNTLTSALFYGWKNGLKTGSYYIRTKQKAQAQQFTIDPNLKNNATITNNKEENNKYEVCEMCSA